MWRDSIWLHIEHTASLWCLNNEITVHIVGQLTSGPGFPGEPSGPLGPKEPYKEKKIIALYLSLFF